MHACQDMDANVKPTVAREVGGYTASRPVIQCFDLIPASKQLYNFDAVASPSRTASVHWSSRVTANLKKILEVFLLRWT